MGWTLFSINCLALFVFIEWTLVNQLTIFVVVFRCHSHVTISAHTLTKLGIGLLHTQLSPAIKGIHNLERSKLSFSILLYSLAEKEFVLCERVH